jgi:outer membrane receptor protein involved in Fe transport
MRTETLCRNLLAGVLLGLTLVSTAVAAPLTGVVVNSRSGQPERGVQLQIEGAGTVATSDLDGLFTLDLSAGTYTAVVKKDGFKSQKVTGIVVTGGGGDFAVVMEPAAAGGSDSFEEEITVTAEAGLSTEAALLAERKGAVQISDSIGAEEMGKSGGSDAAGVLKRVTGISLQDNKFVYVRGLGDRYSSTALNGSKIPSTEFEKKVVPLDLFPADLIDKITVSKSYTVDEPGDFAAGLVELSTVDFPSRQRASIGFSLGWNSVTTGDPWLEYPGGVGFSGGGGQPLPAGIPDEDLIRFSPFSGNGFTPAELEEFGELLIGGWSGVRDDSAPLNGSLKGSYGNTFNDGRLGFVVTGTYENGTSTRDEERNYFRIGAGGIVEPDNTFRFDYSEEKVRQALTANLAYRFGDNHHLQVRSLYTTLSEAEGRFQEGFYSDVNDDIQDFRVSFLEQDIVNVQLAGDHYFDGLGGGALLEWRGSYSEATTAENRREALYEQRFGGGFFYIDASQSGFLYFNDLTDEVDDFKVDWSSFFTAGDTFGTIKFGLSYTNNDREFAGRRLRFFTRGNSGIDFTAPPEELFSADNIRRNGFEIDEATRATDTYFGEHEIPAAYVQADVAWGRWRLIGGVRVEDSSQDVITFDRNNPDNPPIVTALADTDFLPSLSLVYKLTDGANLRFSASQTLNRPEFRELAPFEFTHIVGGFTAVGNPELQRARITSFDARWEWFPSSSEVLAASIFWKEFEDPIERLLLGGALNFETFANVEKAENVGFELEARKDLGHWKDALEGFTIIFNYAFVESEITIDPLVSAVTNDSRPLVGQPDNVGNLILDWSRPESGTNVRVLYNFVDDKVAFAGGFGLPDVIEEARNTVDVVWGQELGGWAKGLQLKVSASNLTDEERLWSQGGGVFRLYEPGREFGLSFSYNPFARR